MDYNNSCNIINLVIFGVIMLKKASLTILLLSIGSICVAMESNRSNNSYKPLWEIVKNPD